MVAGFKKNTKDPLAGAIIRDRKKAPPNNYASKFRIEHIDKVREIMKGGATRHQIINELGITKNTLYTWMHRYPDFARAIRAGDDICDNLVELSLYEKAVGYTWSETVRNKVFNEQGEEVEEVTEIEKQLPPDNSAMIFWLKNRRSHKWKDRHEVTVTQNVNIVTSSELQQLVAQTIDAEYKDVTPP